MFKHVSHLLEVTTAVTGRACTAARRVQQWDAAVPVHQKFLLVSMCPCQLHIVGIPLTAVAVQGQGRQPSSISSKHAAAAQHARRAAGVRIIDGETCATHDLTSLCRNETISLPRAMLSAGLSAQSRGQVAPSGRRCALGRPCSSCDRPCKHPARRQAAKSRGRVAAAAAPDPAAADGSGSEPEAAAAAAAAAFQPAPLGSSPPSPSSLLIRAIAQVLSLAAALACLILLPAYASGRLGQQPLRAAASYILYLLFFASGTISRMLRYGRLAAAQRDAQRSSGGARLALLCFAAVLVPAGHWAAWWDPSLAHLAAAAPKVAAAAASWVLPAAGYSLMLAGWALNSTAAAALGKVGGRLAGRHG